MVAEAFGDKRIELPESALPVFLRLLREKTIPWKSSFFLNRDIMLELNGAEFRIRPNGCINPQATLKGLITNDGPVTFVQWRRSKHLEQNFWGMLAWFVLIGAIFLLLNPIIMNSSQKASYLIVFFFITALGLVVFFRFRYKITNDLKKMEQLLMSVAADAAAEVGNVASANRPILEK